jgi:hypothetical protein
MQPRRHFRDVRHVSETLRTAVLHVTRHTSHVKRHTSHVTCNAMVIRICAAQGSTRSHVSLMLISEEKHTAKS